MCRRVLVTGIGLVTPLGLTTASTWRALLAGETAVREMHHHDAVPIRLAAALAPGSLPPPPPQLSPCPAFAAYAVAAAGAALSDAGLSGPSVTERHAYEYDGDYAGVSIGVGMAHLPTICDAARALDAGRYRRVSPFLVPRILPNTAAGLVSLVHGLRGPSLAPATACAAGAHALCDALHAVRRGDADIMVAGGAEAAIDPIAVAGFGRARALAADPTSAPFDSHRSGFVLGEGAAVLVIEAADHAARRGAAAYAELLGCAATGDAYHVTSPPPDGSGAMRAMRSALRSARVTPADIDYINAHATGTAVGDAIERRAISDVFSNEHAPAGSAVVSSTKGATGHLLGAAGAVEAAFTALSVAHDIVPPTVGLRELDQADDVAQRGWGDLERYVPDTAVRKVVTHAISNSFGFGGTNVCLAFGKPDTEVRQRKLSSVDSSVDNS